MKEVVHKIVGQDDALKLINLSANLNEAALLIGDTGIGKTTIIKNAAESQKREWIRFNLTGDTTVDEFVGKYVLHEGETQWQDGVLLRAMKEGKWLICDEINAALPEILFVLHSLLDDDRHVMVVNHDGEVVRPHADFRFFATMNPVDEYAGTKELNKAFKSRFSFVIVIKTPDGDTEANIIEDRTKVGIGEARKMVMAAKVIRTLKAKKEIFLTVSTRDLLQWGNVSKHCTSAEAFEVTILNKCDDEEEKALILKALRGVVDKVEAAQASGNKDLDPNYYAKKEAEIQARQQQVDEEMKRVAEWAQQLEKGMQSDGGQQGPKGESQPKQAGGNSSDQESSSLGDESKKADGKQKESSASKGNSSKQESSLPHQKPSEQQLGKSTQQAQTIQTPSEISNRLLEQLHKREMEEWEHQKALNALMGRKTPPPPPVPPTKKRGVVFDTVFFDEAQ